MVMIVGHRGARNLWPENSLSGFRRTAALGIEAVEFDVHMARDGVPVVIHDPSLDRTAHGTGWVAARTSTELAAVPLRDAGGEGVPTLDAVLGVFAGGATELQVEIKTDGGGSPYPGLERAVIDRIRARGLAGRARITCFVPAVLEAARAVWPEAPLVASLDRRSAEMLGGLEPAIDRFLAFGDCCIAIERTLLAPELDRCLARIGPDRLGAWVPNDREDVAFWMARPIRQITTDRPDVAVDFRAAA
ncbi:MAG: glycerophosphodiester phosphodiesterase family protein [Alphaproteobacteria bacterium]